MPFLAITTNVDLTPEAEAAWTAEASKAIAAELGKPEAYVMVSLTKSTMSFAGSAEPAAFLCLESIGLPRDCEPVAKALTHIAECHGVPVQRVYFNCTDFSAARWAHAGATFA
jgi:phenylpyruvate tautomerase